MFATFGSVWSAHALRHAWQPGGCLRRKEHTYAACTDQHTRGRTCWQSAGRRQRRIMSSNGGKCWRKWLRDASSHLLRSVLSQWDHLDQYGCLQTNAAVRLFGRSSLQFWSSKTINSFNSSVWGGRRRPTWPWLWPGKLQREANL